MLHHWDRYCTCVRPTAHPPGHTITETEEVARALDDAARRWPEERAARSTLLLRAARDAPAEAVVSFDERLLGVARGMGLLSTRVSVTDISQ